MGLFVDERGYTSIAVAVALLVSVSLVFGVASAEWTLSRGADVQEVADAASLAGSNVVSAYCTVAQALDACVLSLGLSGMAVMGSGLVLAAVPGAQTASAKALEVGRKVLEARRRFATSVTEGLGRLEHAIPALCVANSYGCASANSTKDMRYTGVAIPFPLESRSDFSTIESDVSGEEVSDAADRLRDATGDEEQAKERADEARERGWRADCVDDPSCMRSRASSLAKLGEAENPLVPSPESWDFGMAIRRARSYYAQRVRIESPKANDIESVTDSLAREAWYRYALEEVNGAWYLEGDDGSVDLHVPHLARNADEVRDCWLYTDDAWPCTDEEGGRTLHSTLDCPGAVGPFSGTASVEDVETGAVLRCDSCKMGVRDLGAVASISTSAKNGFEHYWQQVVEAAQDYEAARNEQAEAERAMRSAAEEGRDVFDRALEQLRVPRPHICPPGAWGCVSVVRRGGDSLVPEQLTRSFLSGTDIPAGVAVSASVLACDETTGDNDVLSRFFDGLSADASSSAGSALDGLMGLWGRLLRSYGSSYEDVGSAVGGFLDKLDGIFGGTVGAWLKRKVAETMGALGLEPADMRLRKPVLTNTRNVLAQAGFDPDGKVRNLVQSLPADGTPVEVARALGTWVWNDWQGRAVTVAEVPIPGTDVSVPLTIDIEELGDVA